MEELEKSIGYTFKNKNLQKELPFMATENIMMNLVKNGGDRQEIHERIRVHSMEATKRMKEFGTDENDLLQRIADDPFFNITLCKLNEILDPYKYTGICKEQVENFIKESIDKILNNEKTSNDFLDITI